MLGLIKPYVEYIFGDTGITEKDLPHIARVIRERYKTKIHIYFNACLADPDNWYIIYHRPTGYNPLTGEGTF